MKQFVHTALKAIWIPVIFLATQAFGAPPLFPGEQIQLGNAGKSAALGDLDNDGDLDIVAITESDVNIMLNDGAGAFSAPVTLSTGGEPSGVAVGDLDNDGDLDFAVTNFDILTNGDISVFLNDGAGAFAGPTQFAGLKNMQYITIIDLNGNNLLDIAIGAKFWAIYALFNDNLGILGAPALILPVRFPSAMSFLDLDADGDVDVVAAGSSGNTL